MRRCTIWRIATVLPKVDHQARAEIHVLLLRLDNGHDFEEGVDHLRAHELGDPFLVELEVVGLREQVVRRPFHLGDRCAAFRDA